MSTGYRSILPCVMWSVAEQRRRTTRPLPPVKQVASETEILRIGSNLKKRVEKSTRTNERQSSTKRLAGGYWGGRNSEIVAAEISRNHHAIDAGGAQRVIIATLRAWIGSRLNSNWKYRLNERE